MQRHVVVSNRWCVHETDVGNLTDLMPVLIGRVKTNQPHIHLCCGWFQGEGGTVTRGAVIRTKGGSGAGGEEDDERASLTP